MPDPSANWPINWEDYEAGRSPRHGSEGSLGSHVQFDGTATPTRGSNRLHLPRPDENRGQSPRASGTLRHRRSSLSMRLSSVAQAGGPNSIENFARSWSRAAAFIEIPPSQPSFVIDEGGDSSVGSRKLSQPVSPAETTGLLRQQLERQGTDSAAVHDDEDVPAEQQTEETPEAREAAHGPHESSGLFERAPWLSSPFSSSYGGVYGSFSSRANDSPMRHAGRLFSSDPQAHSAQDPDKEAEPLLIKFVEQKDGTKIPVVVGQSTLPQTIFNSINVLIGVGLLSLPLGLKQAGWLIGMLFLFASAIVTRYTGGLLAKCLDVDPSLITFSDLAWKAFGPKARIATGLLFTVELIGACVALVILFADSLNALIPGLGITSWKIFCGIILIPLSFVPLRYLSFTSVLGILSCLGIVTLIFVDGILKPHAPGSLRDPIMSTLWPARWSDLPLSFGLIMSPWGGHSVFPNIYRDMRHPAKYTRAINSTYAFTYPLDLAVAVAGYLMFGRWVHDEVTSNIFLTKGYPESISVCIVVFIAIIPLTKVPLNARPIFVITENLLGLNRASDAGAQSSEGGSAAKGMGEYMRKGLRGVTRTLTLVVIVALAVVVPGFDTVMALLGSVMAFSICVILPLCFNLKLFHGHLGGWETGLNWFLIVVSSIMAVVGTVWVFLPQAVRHRLDGF